MTAAFLAGLGRGFAPLCHSAAIAAVEPERAPA